MKTIILFALFLVTSFVSAETVSFTATSNQIIVKFKGQAKGLSEGTQRAFGQSKLFNIRATTGMNIQYKRPMSGDAHVFALPEQMTIQSIIKIIKKIKQNPDVELAQVDYIMYPVMVPNDPMYQDQWHYHAASDVTGGANLPGAWDITTGSEEIVVAVIDTGITEHSEFDGRLVDGYDFISDAMMGNDGDGRDADPSDAGDWMDAQECSRFYPPYQIGSSWHGTHVAGTMAANSNNGNGVAGINWESKIQTIRVLGKCGGHTSDIADGIRWAAGGTVPGIPANPNPSKVLNMSLGGGSSCDSISQSAIDDANANGATVVVAAGNSSADAANYSPASCDGVITVASTNEAGDLSFYSNYSTSIITISAPGGEMDSKEDEGILSTLNTGTTVPEEEGYAYYQGTSMASPHVAGIVSLMYSANPNITPAQVKQILIDTARPFASNTSCAQNNHCGAGIIDAEAAVIAAQNADDDTSGGDDDNNSSPFPRWKNRF